VTSWGTVLIVAFLALGLSRRAERAAFRVVVALATALLLAVSVGKL
jgi:hypothetical protein